MTWIVTVAVSVPHVFVAVIVYTVEEVTVEGVPSMTPVVLLMVRPDGRVGLTDQPTTVPAVEVGVAGLDIGEFFVRV